MGAREVFFRIRVEGDLEAGGRDIERFELFRDPPRKAFRALFALFRERLARRIQLLCVAIEQRFELFALLGAVFKQLQLLLRAGKKVKRLFDRATVLLFERFDLVEAVFHALRLPLVDVELFGKRFRRLADVLDLRKRALQPFGKSGVIAVLFNGNEPAVSGIHGVRSSAVRKERVAHRPESA